MNCTLVSGVTGEPGVSRGLEIKGFWPMRGNKCNLHELHRPITGLESAKTQKDSKVTLCWHYETLYHSLYVCVIGNPMMHTNPTHPSTLANIYQQVCPILKTDCQISFSISHIGARHAFFCHWSIIDIVGGFTIRINEVQSVIKNSWAWTLGWANKLNIFQYCLK